MKIHENSFFLNLKHILEAHIILDQIKTELKFPNKIKIKKTPK